MGEQGEGRGLMGLSGSGEPEKGKSFEMEIKNISNKKKDKEDKEKQTDLNDIYKAVNSKYFIVCS